MATAPKKFVATNRHGQTATITAESYEQHGSGTFFYDADGRQVCSFGDGEIRSVMPEGVSFSGGEA